MSKLRAVILYQERQRKAKVVFTLAKWIPFHFRWVKSLVIQVLALSLLPPSLLSIISLDPFACYDLPDPRWS